MSARGAPLGRPFAALLGGIAASGLADGIAFVALPMLAAGLGGDARLVAAVAGTSAVVRLLVALPAGVLIDRVDRRLVLAWANALRGIAVLGLAALVSVGAAGALALAAVVGIAAALESAADQVPHAVVPALVDRPSLERANGRVAAAQLLADDVAGPPVGGALAAVALAVPLAAMGGLWLAAAALALALPAMRPGERVPRETRPGAGAVADAVEGLRALAAEPTVRLLALLGGAASAGYMIPFSVLVLIADGRLGLTGAGYGALLSVSAVGGLVGAAAAPRLLRRLGPRGAIAGSLALGAASLALLASATGPAVAALALVAYVLHATVWAVCATTLRQRLVPGRLLGRVGAATRLVALLGLAVGAIAGGELATASIAAPAMAGAAVFAVAAVAALALPRILPESAADGSAAR